MLDEVSICEIWHISTDMFKEKYKLHLVAGKVSAKVINIRKNKLVVSIFILYSFKIEAPKHLHLG